MFRNIALYKERALMVLINRAMRKRDLAILFIGLAFLIFVLIEIYRKVLMGLPS